MMRFNLVAALLLLGSHVTEAFPTGAGGCDAGNLLLDSDAGTSHRTRTVVTGTLDEADFEVSVDGQTLTSGSALNITAVLPHRIVLSATGDKAFRGFLIRASDPAGTVDTTEILGGIPLDSETQTLGLCTSAGVGGVTHTNNNEKTEITALMSTEFDFENPSIPLTLDITMVVQNRDSTSEFYYSQFTVNSVTPDASNPPCPICGDLILTMPENAISLTPFPLLITTSVNTTCGDLDNFNAMGFVPEIFCGQFQSAIGPQCGCSETGGTPTMAPPTPTPPPGPPTQAPGPEPETSAGASIGVHAAVVILGGVGAALFM